MGVYISGFINQVKRFSMTQYKQSPILFDRLMQSIQKGLLDKLTWLNNAYGRSFTLETTTADGRSIKFPAVYIGAGDYLSMFPDDNLGSYSFFEIYDPQTLDAKSKTTKIQNAKGAIVFWIDMSRIFADNAFLHIEEIKNDILMALRSIRLEPGDRMELLELYESPKNVFKGYNISQIEGQYLTYPYYGLRIEVSLNTEVLCL